MRRRLLILLAGIAVTQVNAQEVEDSVTTGAGYQNQIWYSLENDNQGSADKDEWDIAFQIAGFSASILANTQKADFILYNSPYKVADWASLDTAGITSWEVLYNADTSWDVGAFNTHPTSDFDLGWGIYNPTTHVVAGDSIYVIKIGTTWKKIKIDNLTSGVYNFTFADVDGANEVVTSVDKADFSGKNFAYYSIINETEIDREPASEDWDLSFEYRRYAPGAFGNSAHVLQNVGVEIVQISDVPEDEAEYTGQELQSAINIIGYDWKSFTGAWVVHDSTTFFVKDIDGNYWKLYFTGFGGTGNGKHYFTKEKIATAGVEENTSLTTHIYPNPLSGNQLTVIYDQNGSLSNAQISIIDMSGRTVYHDTFEIEKGLQKHVITTPDLKSGIYQVVTQQDNQISTQKLMVK